MCSATMFCRSYSRCVTTVLVFVLAPPYLLLSLLLPLLSFPLLRDSSSDITCKALLSMCSFKYLFSYGNSFYMPHSHCFFLLVVATAEGPLSHNLLNLIRSLSPTQISNHTPPPPHLTTSISSTSSSFLFFQYGTPDQCEALALLLSGQSVQLGTYVRRAAETHTQHRSLDTAASA